MTIRQALQGARDIINPAAAEARKKAEAEAKHRAAEERLDLRWLLSDARGRRIAARILSRCHLLASTYASDQRITERAEGRREFALSLFGDLVSASPDEALDLFQLDPTVRRHKQDLKASNAGVA